MSPFIVVMLDDEPPAVSDPSPDAPTEMLVAAPEDNRPSTMFRPAVRLIDPPVPLVLMLASLRFMSVLAKFAFTEKEPFMPALWKELGSAVKLVFAALRFTAIKLVPMDAVERPLDVILPDEDPTVIEPVVFVLTNPLSRRFVLARMFILPELVLSVVKFV